MIGFFIGTVCLIGLLATLRGGAYGRGYGYGGGHCGGRRWRHGHWHEGHARGWDDGPPDPWGRRTPSESFEGEDFRRPSDDGDRFHAPYGRGFGGHGFPRPGFGFGKRWFLRGLFERLRTTPEQERTIVDALDEASEQRAKIRQEMKASRKDIARAIRGESVEETVLGDVFSRHDNVLEEVRKAMVAALVKIHAVLDERQRTQLGEIVEGGWFSRF